ncbi:uncharacterized protein LOC111518624 isoform X2 [Drosophila willistoni]|uniref:uncharacterized protein LOC111518624 isoform X2 n=1 Tax=Drosophila willistoni TaxID=7260 RepID=UPI001F07B3C0|nr:uncharacterized protein LOC111518624 isoform X2 [Drosophila willistoni]
MMMNHPFGPNGPYFQRPCQRDRFPSLIDEIGPLADPLVNRFGIPEFQEMGARLKRGKKLKSKVERDAASAAIWANAEPAAAYAHDYHLVIRRAMDPYLPRYEPLDYNDPTQLSAARRLAKPALTPRQEGEPNYTGSCYHCKTSGSNDDDSDRKGRELAQDILLNPDLNSHLLHHIAQIQLNDG